MKKLLKKRYFVPLLVVAVMAIAATAAYAWWTTSTSIADNEVTTGRCGPELRIHADQRRQPDPAGRSERRSHRLSPGWLQDQLLLGPEHRARDPVDGLRLTSATSYDPTESRARSWSRSPSLRPTRRGTRNRLALLGAGARTSCTAARSASSSARRRRPSRYLTRSTRTHPLAAGQYAFYRVVSWLDGPADNNDSHATRRCCTLKFESVPSTDDPSPRVDTTRLVAGRRFAVRPPADSMTRELTR